MNLIILILSAFISVGLDLALIPAALPTWPLLVSPIFWSFLAWRYREGALISFLLTGLLFDSYSSSRFGFWSLALISLLLAFLLLKKALRNDLLYLVASITLANILIISFSQEEIVKKILNLSFLLSLVTQVIIALILMFIYQKRNQRSAGGIINIPF